MNKSKATIYFKLTLSVLISLAIVIIQADKIHAYAYRQASIKKTSHKDSCIWNRLTKNFQLDHATRVPKVQYYIKHFRNNRHELTTLTERAIPYMFHIIEKIETQETSLPNELAIIPMVESGFIPHARSNVGATGLWQINSITAKHLGLKINKWYDERLDIRSSTNAALNYLNELNYAFNNDWLLTFAAYNTGPSSVKKAIQINKKKGLSTNFWNLPLPKPTKHFVAKILAICHLIKEHEFHQVQLSSIKNRPYFTSLEFKKQINLQFVAHLAELPYKELKRLNTGYKKHTTNPMQPQVLLLPISNANRFKFNLSKLSKKQSIDSLKLANYKIEKGDCLSTIANKYKTNIETLRFLNQLKGDLIRIGSTLSVPIYY